MMHSIIPNDVIFAESNQQFQQKISDVGGVPVLLSCQAGGRFRVERVLSTNPQDYLKENMLGREMNLAEDTEFEGM